MWDDFVEFFFGVALPGIGGIASGIVTTLFYVNSTEVRNVGLSIIIFLISTFVIGNLLFHLRMSLLKSLLYVFLILAVALAISLGVYGAIESSSIKF